MADEGGKGFDGVADAFKIKFEEQLEDEYRRLKKPNVLIAGRTGVGKSTLINTIFGSNLAEVGAGRPVTDCYREYSSDTQLVKLFDSVGWEGGGEKEAAFIDDSRRFLQSRNASGAPEDRLHIVWYALDAPGARFTEFDAKLAGTVFDEIPVLFVLTKSDIASDDQLDALRKEINDAKLPNTVGIVEVAADPLVRRGTPICRPFGLEEVVKRTLDLLPELVRRAFIAAQRLSLPMKADEARKVILAACAAAFGVGWSPIPFSDAPLLVALQAGMVAKIAVIYGARPGGALGAMIAGLGAGMLAASSGMFLANMLKFIPGLGTTIGGLINASVGAAITAAIGFVFRAAFHEMSRRVLDGMGHTITTEWMKDFVDERFQRALSVLKAKGRSAKPEDFEALD